MNREDGDSSNSGDYHNSRRLEPRENYVHGRMMMTQYSGFQPTYSVVSHVYYYPWVDPTTYPVPSSYGEAGRRGAAYRTSPLADGNGGFYITAVGSSSWWDQSRSSRASSGGDRHFATTYMLGKNSLLLLRLELHPLALVPDGFFYRYLFRSALSLPAFFVPGFLHVIRSLCRNTGLVGPPWVPVLAQAPSISNQRDSLSRRRPPNSGGRNRCRDGAARRLPAPPSRTAPRNNAPPVSVDGTSCSDRAPGTDSPLVSMNSASGSGTALNNTGTCTPVPQQSQGADPVNGGTSPRHNLNSTARGGRTSDGANHREADDCTDGDRQADKTLDRRVVDEIIALARSDPGSSRESIIRQIKATTSSLQPSSTSENDQAAAPCVICLDELKDQQTIRRLSCGHEYHLHCVEKWLRLKNECPVCKSRAQPLNRNDQSVKKWAR